VTTPTVRNPCAEATALLPDGHEARVLEPSPPADTDRAWLADDPTDPAGAEGTVVSPVSGGDLTWDALTGDDPGLAAYAHDHWLTRTRQLDPLPDRFAATRDAMHQLAFFVVAPKRYAQTGKLGLRWTAGGFGTPFYATDAGDEQVRMEGDLLVVQSGAQVRAIRPRTVREACAFVGIECRDEWFADFHDPLTPTGPDVRLELDPVAAGAVGDWFGFATAVLEELRRTPGAVDVGRVQLWPEHFDPAVELGDGRSGQRASYGASPGDAGHDEPYLYVAPWREVDKSDPYWNDTSFDGASLGYAELLDSTDPVGTALQFLWKGMSG